MVLRCALRARELRYDDDDINDNDGYHDGADDDDDDDDDVDDGDVLRFSFLRPPLL